MQYRVIDKSSSYFNMVGTVYEKDEFHVYLDFDCDNGTEYVFNKENGKDVFHNYHFSTYQLREEVIPEVGMPVTIMLWSDRHIGTITEVSKSKKKIKFQYDEFKLVNGVGSGQPDELKFYPGGFAGTFVGVPRYEVIRDTNGRTSEARMDKYVNWRKPNRGSYVIIGVCSPNYDMNF